MVYLKSCGIYDSSKCLTSTSPSSSSKQPSHLTTPLLHFRMYPGNLRNGDSSAKCSANEEANEYRQCSPYDPVCMLTLNMLLVMPLFFEVLVKVYFAVVQNSLPIKTNYSLTII